MEALVIRKIIGGEVRAFIVRPEVVEFAIAMEMTLREHDQEHPNGKNDNLDMLYDHFLEETDEVNLAFQEIRPGRNPSERWNHFSQECVDVANMCMMMAKKAQEMNAINQCSVVKNDACHPGS